MKCGAHAPSWFTPGMWPRCACGFDPHDNRILTQHWEARGIKVVDDHGTLIEVRL